MIKILLGGSPCTFWSIAQRNNRETEASGQGWELFKNYLIAKEKFKPDLFLYENNKSAAPAIKEQISKELNTDLMYINSALVSAQNRERFYAFNWQCEQPKDRGVVVKDILQSGIVDREKSYVLKHQAGNARDYLKKHHTQVAFEPVAISDTKNGKARTIKASYYKNGIRNILNQIEPQTGAARPVRIGDVGTSAQGYRVYSSYGKSTTITANGSGVGGKTGLYMVAVNREGLPLNNETCYSENGGAILFENEEHKTITVHIVRGGQIRHNGKEYPINLPDGYLNRSNTPLCLQGAEFANDCNLQRER